MKKSSHRKQRYPHARQRRQDRAQRSTAPQDATTHGTSHVARLIAVARAGGLVGQARVAHVTVDHDATCRTYVGPCICEPGITATTADGRVLSIDVAGEVVRARMN